MALTNIRGQQIQDGTIQRTDLDTSTVGLAVVAKIIQGANISLSSTGGDAGTGDVTISSPTVVSSDSGNQATIGSDSRLYVPNPTPVITSVRLRSYNAVGNPNFEIDQRNIGNSVVNPANAVLPFDRWLSGKAVSTLAFNVQSSVPGTPVLLPGTSFKISRNACLYTLTTAQASLAAGDLLYLVQSIEGPMMRELSSDVTSLSLLINSSVANLSFSINIRDNPVTKSLVKLCTIPSANTWTLISLPNIPAFPAGNWGNTAGAVGAFLGICFACGSTNMAPAADVWQTGSYLGAPGMSNWGASPVNSTIQIGFVQWEPGSQCTTLLDKPFTDNLLQCERYYQKSYLYSAAAGSTGYAGSFSILCQSGQNPNFYVPYRTRLAKLVTPGIYSPATGASNAVRNINTGADITVNTVTNPGETGYQGVTLSALPGAAAQVVWHWVADTGW